MFVVIFKTDYGVDDDDRTGCRWAAFGGICTRRTSMLLAVVGLLYDECGIRHAK